MKRSLSGSSLALFALLALLPSCSTTPHADLAINDGLYTDTGYATKLPGDRTVFVAPLGDERKPPVDAASAQYPIAYDGDGRWERSVVDMIDDLLRRELEASGVFAEVLPQPAKADVVLTPKLVTFATAAIEHESGGRSLAEVGVRVLAFGPAGADGKRPLLLDQVFGDRQVSDIAFRTQSRHVLAGAAARAAMLRLLQGLDSKNIGRSSMPTAPMPDGTDK